MILDTSAIVELILGLPDSARIERALTQASSVGVGAPTLAEAGIESPGVKSPGVKSQLTNNLNADGYLE